MKSDISKSARTTGSIIKYFAVALVFIFFYAGKTSGWNEYWLSGEIAAALVAIFSFLYLHVRIGKKEIPKSSRRVGVILNYGALMILLVLLYIAEKKGPNLPLVIGVVATLAVVITSFVIVQMRTKLWNFTHSDIEQLDERQVYVIHESLRNSYSIFSVICLSVFLAGELTGEWLPGLGDLSFMPIIAALIYTAHTLPSSIIAWTEKEI